MTFKKKNQLSLAQHESAYIALLSLKVLYNLSFDVGIRASLAENGGLFQQLVGLLRHPPFRQIVLRLLYQRFFRKQNIFILPSSLTGINSLRTTDVAACSHTMRTVLYMSCSWSCIFREMNALAKIWSRSV